MISTDASDMLPDGDILVLEETPPLLELKLVEVIMRLLIQLSFPSHGHSHYYNNLERYSVDNNIHNNLLATVNWYNKLSMLTNFKTRNGKVVCCFSPSPEWETKKTPSDHWRPVPVFRNIDRFLAFAHTVHSFNRFIK